MAKRQKGGKLKLLKEDISDLKSHINFLVSAHIEHNAAQAKLTRAKDNLDTFLDGLNEEK